MYKLGVPILCQDLKTAKSYLPSLQKAKVDRVWLCGFHALGLGRAENPEMLKNLKEAVDFYRENGVEVGIWVEAFGHGGPLTHEREDSKVTLPYTQLTGLIGEGNPWGRCPKDENFSSDFARGMAALATTGPDIMMLDDDYRLNGRPSYRAGCFCPAHLKEYYERIGEEIPKEKLWNLIFTGGKNKYRDAYLDMSGETLLAFGRKVRREVNKVNPKIRLGVATIRENWDFCGTDALEIARAFAGDTAPFVRTMAAPYHSITGAVKLPDVLETTRMQLHWAEKEGVEMFTEGDVYPRPRYNVNAASLELYDTVLCVEGTADGILKYMYDYTTRVDYETGYVDRHLRNMPFREEVRKMFADKKIVGVQPYNVLHKVRDWELDPEDIPEADNIMTKIGFHSPSSLYLSRNSIPTAHRECEYPLLITGENAKYIPLEQLKRGAVLDIKAARILQSRGVDCGLVSEEPADVFGEYFDKYDDTILAVTSGMRFKKITCKESAQVWSHFTPENSPASYIYENQDGLRFYVLASDYAVSGRNANYYENYDRQQDMVEALEYVGRKKLPAVSLKNPCLYLMTAKNEKTMGVLLANMFADMVLEPKIVLDKPYKSIRFVNCTGRLEGNTVCLEDMSAFAMAAFEVTE